MIVFLWKYPPHGLFLSPGTFSVLNIELKWHVLFLTPSVVFQHVITTSPAREKDTGDRCKRMFPCSHCPTGIMCHRCFLPYVMGQIQFDAFIIQAFTVHALALCRVLASSLYNSPSLCHMMPSWFLWRTRQVGCKVTWVLSVELQGIMEMSNWES